MFIHVNILESGACELNIWPHSFPFGTTYTKIFSSESCFDVLIYSISYVVVFLIL